MNGDKNVAQFVLKVVLRKNPSPDSNNTLFSVVEMKSTVVGRGEKSLLL